MTEPSLQDPVLTWGVLSFIPPEDDGVESEDDIESEAAAFEIEAIDGTNRGNPVPIVETLPSLLIEGALAMVTGYENREIPIRLRISANDGDALSEAEAALFAQVQQTPPPPLQWTSPVGNSATSIYDTVVAVLEEDTSEGWDLAEVMAGERFYNLTLQALPFARAAESTVVPALPVPADPDTEDWTDVDTCDSIVDWSVESNDPGVTGPTAIVGPPTAIEATAVIDAASDHLRLVRTGAIVVPDDYYLAVDVKGADYGVGWGFGQWRGRFDGEYRDPIATTYDGEDGSLRLFFDNVGTIAELAILRDFETGRGGFAGVTPLRVYNVAHTDTLGSSSTTTNRQQSRLVTVSGSAPTQAQLRLADATPAALGDDVLIYTSRNTTWRPNLRRWVDDSEAPTGDPARVSGAQHSLATVTKFLIPADQLTLGTYALMALMDIAVDGTLSWQARMTTLAGEETIGTGVVQSGTVDLTVTDGFKVVDLAALILPVVEVAGGGYAVELTLTGTSDMLLDEAWLFSLDDGVLTWVHDQEGIHWAEVRSPELGAARPSVWGGLGALGADASCIDWKCLSFGPHRFDPGVVQIFTVCTASLVAQCEIEFFARYFGNVRGEEAA